MKTPQKPHELLAFILLFLSLSFSVSAQKNILVFIVDDLRPELGCYGEEHIHSPNIDELARHGMLFKNAHVQQSVCPASRSSFLSSARPNSTGADYPYSSYFVNEFMFYNSTLQKHFYENGFKTVTLGKVHHGGYKDEEGKEVSTYFRPSDDLLYALEENKSAAAGFKAAVERANVPDSAYRDGIVTKRAIAELKRIKKGSAPFFLAVGYYKPHLPFAAPSKYWDYYKRDEIPLSLNPQHPAGSNDYTTSHTALKNYKGENDENGNLLSDEYARELRHGYFACVSFIDAQIGIVMDSLKALDLYENTVVVIMSDHGYHLGDHGMWGKATNFTRATKIPLIISNAGPENIESQELVEAVDVYPTLCDLAQIPTPIHSEGTSLVPLLLGPNTPWKTAAFSQYPKKVSDENLEGYSVVDENYRYTEWRTMEDKVQHEELYDLLKDPIESKNVVHLKEYKDAKAAMKLKLAKGWKQALPNGISNQSHNPVAPPHQNYQSNSPYILSQKVISHPVNHPLHVQLSHLDSVIDRNDVYANNFELKLFSGANYRLNDTIIVPDLGYLGELPVFLKVEDPKGKKSNKFPLIVSLRLPITSRETVVSDSFELEVGFAKNDDYRYVTNDLVLQDSAKYGSRIIWRSLDTSIISNSGRLMKRPDNITNVRLKARIRKKGQVTTKLFRVRVWPAYHKLQAFPNPFDDAFTVYSPESFSRLNLLDETGRLVKQYELNENVKQLLVPTNDLPNGTYLIEVSGKNGKRQLRVLKPF